ncbi:MAG: helix-turn-helix domain-containing protein [Caldilineaceae bacterium]|nr:helix-turn-helix domain-containing protein [Caldilineaceae bacterium]
MTEPSTLGKQLLTLRLENGYGYARAAAAIGISAKLLRIFEWGWEVPNPATLERIANVYGVTAESLRALPTVEERPRPEEGKFHIIISRSREDDNA